MLDRLENEKAPDVAPSEAKPNTVEANDAALIADSRQSGNRSFGGNAPKEQPRRKTSTLPGFTAPPVWEYAKYDGRLIAGEREFKGRFFFELRLWSGEHGDKATHKGVTMPIEAVPDLARALAAYCATIAPSDSENGS